MLYKIYEHCITFAITNDVLLFYYDLLLGMILARALNT
jgi:hypothetical protein